MGELSEVASAILSRASRNVDVRAQNIANLTTPGYKRRVSFASVLGAERPGEDVRRDASGVDFTDGKLIQTGNPSDLAILGDGFFAVRAPSGQVLYTRQGQFRRDGEGRLATASGLVLQGEGGGDLVVRDGPFAVAADGVVTSGGEPVGRIGLARFADLREAVEAVSGAFSAPGDRMEAVTRPQVQQGALEASNVSTAEEMTGMMAALRQAETGQRLMMVYDDLMGRVLTTFGQA